MKVFILRRIIIVSVIDQKQNFWLIMLRLKYMASNTYVTLDPKSQIPYHKKQKNIATLEAFKTKIRRWKSICTCRICRIYIRIVFIYLSVICICIYWNRYSTSLNRDLLIQWWLFYVGHLRFKLVHSVSVHWIIREIWENWTNIAKIMDWEISHQIIPYATHKCKGYLKVVYLIRVISS